MNDPERINEVNEPFVDVIREFFRVASDEFTLQPKDLEISFARPRGLPLIARSQCSQLPREQNWSRLSQFHSRPLRPFFPSSGETAQNQEYDSRRSIFFPRPRRNRRGFRPPISNDGYCKGDNSNILVRLLPLAVWLTSSPNDLRRIPRYRANRIRMARTRPPQSILCIRPAPTHLAAAELNTRQTPDESGACDRRIRVLGGANPRVLRHAI